MEIKRCRSCYHDTFRELLDLGPQYIINFGNKEPITTPIVLVMCSKCKLVQLQHYVDPDLLYRHFYYKSGVNQTMRTELKDIVNSAMKLVDPCPEDTVIDIGSNDGTLLLNYPPSLNKIGFEPAENLCTDENYPNSRIINHYFSDNWGLPKAKIITAIAMFYDLQDPNVFMNAVKNSLHEDGIFIIQMNYLVKMIENNAVDNVLIEHACYYTLNTLQWLLDRVDMTIFRAELNDINGGSIRIYMKHRHCDKYKVGPEVDIIKKYVERGYDEQREFNIFAMGIDCAGQELYSFLKAHGPVWALGASTRGNTMLQMFGIGNDLITAVADRNPDKHGTTMVGTNIPVKSEDEWRKVGPPHTLILPYYFAKEIMEREKDYMAGGGKFIIPLPEFKIHG